MNDVDIAIAVVTGKHAFDIPGFQQMFSSMSNMEFYLQDLENFVADVGKYNDKYDVILFYNFHQQTPVADERDGAIILNSINKLAENGQGIFLLHHAILAFPHWEIWSQIVGVADRRFGYHGNQTVQTDLMDDSHPITYGLKSWEMVDETYTMNEVRDEFIEFLKTINSLEDPEVLLSKFQSKKISNDSDEEKSKSNEKK